MKIISEINFDDGTSIVNIIAFDNGKVSISTDEEEISLHKSTLESFIEYLKLIQYITSKNKE